MTTTDRDRCARARCRAESVVIYLGVPLCRRHYDEVLDRKWGERTKGNTDADERPGALEGGAPPVP
jgi:hypothetical protein